MTEQEIRNNSALSLKEHVEKRLLERFDIKIDQWQYNFLNKIASKQEIIYTSDKNTNCDFRQINYKGKIIICVFDNKLNKIKTVLKPIYNNPELFLELKIGKIYTGQILSQKNYGYLVLINNIITLLHKTEIKGRKISIGDRMEFKIIANFIDKISNNNRVFLKICK